MRGAAPRACGRARRHRGCESESIDIGDVISFPCHFAKVRDRLPATGSSAANRARVRQQLATARDEANRRGAGDGGAHLAARTVALGGLVAAEGCRRSW